MQASDNNDSRLSNSFSLSLIHCTLSVHSHTPQCDGIHVCIEQYSIIDTINTGPAVVVDNSEQLELTRDRSSSIYIYIYIRGGSMYNQ